jgi:phytoene synthase
MHASDKTSDKIIEASYHFCRRMCRRSGSNFIAGFLLLPKPKRRAMWALYAFMRHSDDLVDSPTESPAEALAAWRAEVQEVLQRGAWDVGQGAWTNVSPLPLGEGADILPALADVVRRFGIPHAYLFAVLDGMEMDLRWRSYRTFAELEEYCHRAASAVGLACIHVWGFDGPAAIEPARQAGVALQLTNILRDLGEDTAAGRVYLPLEDFSSAGYSIDELRRGVVNDGFSRLMELEISRVKRYYDAAGELMSHLSRDGQRIHGVLMDTYRRLLDKIERRPTDVLRQRIRLSRFEKLGIVARHVPWKSHARRLTAFC